MDNLLKRSGQLAYDGASEREPLGLLAFPCPARRGQRLEELVDRAQARRRSRTSPKLDVADCRACRQVYPEVRQNTFAVSLGKCVDDSGVAGLARTEHAVVPVVDVGCRLEHREDRPEIGIGWRLDPHPEARGEVLGVVQTANDPAKLGPDQPPSDIDSDRLGRVVHEPFTCVEGFEHEVDEAAEVFDRSSVRALLFILGQVNGHAAT